MNDANDNNQRDDEILSAFIDGELAVDQLTSTRARLLAEPRLRARYDRLKCVDERLRGALHAAGGDSVPEHIRQLLTPEEAETGSLATMRRAGWGLAIAATILAVSGQLLNPQWRNADDNRDAEIASILEMTPSRGSGWESLPGGDTLRPVLSFRSNSGTWCREYLLRADDGAWRGVACREDRVWRTRVISDVGEREFAEDRYRPAGAGDSDSITTFIDRHAADVPLSAREEAALIDSEWR